MEPIIHRMVLQEKLNEFYMTADIKAIPTLLIGKLNHHHYYCVMRGGTVLFTEQGYGQDFVTEYSINEFEAFEGVFNRENLSDIIAFFYECEKEQLRSIKANWFPKGFAYANEYKQPFQQGILFKGVIHCPKTATPYDCVYNTETGEIKLRLRYIPLFHQPYVD